MVSQFFRIQYTADLKYLAVLVNMEYLADHQLVAVIEGKSSLVIHPGKTNRQMRLEPVIGHYQ